MKYTLIVLTLIGLTGCNGGDITYSSTNSASQTPTTGTNPSSGGGNSAPAASVDHTLTVTNHIYIASYNNNSIYQYNLDSSTGEIQEIDGNIMVQADYGTCNLIMHSSKKFIYSANCLSNTISQFMVNTTTGTLTPQQTRDIGFSVNTHIQEMGFDSTGQYLYVKIYQGTGYTTGAAKTLYKLSIDQTTGVLTKIGAVADDTSGNNIAPYLQQNGISMTIVNPITLGDYSYSLSNDGIEVSKNGTLLNTTYMTTPMAMIVR